MALRYASTRPFLHATNLPIRLHSLVEGLLAARLPSLQLAILPLEPPSLLLARKYLLHKRLLPLLVLDPARKELRRTLNDGAHLAVLRRLHLTAVLLVVPVRIKDVAHFEKLQVALELGRKVGARKVEPLGAGRSLLGLCQ